MIECSDDLTLPKFGNTYLVPRRIDMENAKIVEEHRRSFWAGEKPLKTGQICIQAQIIRPESSAKSPPKLRPSDFVYAKETYNNLTDTATSCTVSYCF